MVLDWHEFIINGVVTFNDYNVGQLYKYNSIRLKSLLRNRKLSDDDMDDIIQAAVLKCMDKIMVYNPQKNDQLGGYLSLVVRGELTKFYNKARHTVPMDESFENVEGTPDRKNYTAYSDILKNVSSVYNGQVHYILDTILEELDDSKRRAKIKAFRSAVEGGCFCFMTWKLFLLKNILDLKGWGADVND